MCKTFVKPTAGLSAPPPPVVATPEDVFTNSYQLLSRSLLTSLPMVPKEVVEDKV